MLLCHIIMCAEEYWYAQTQQFNFQEDGPGKVRVTGKGLLVFFWDHFHFSILLPLYFCLIWPMCFAKQQGLTLSSMPLFTWDQYKAFTYILQSLDDVCVFPVNLFGTMFLIPFKNVRHNIEIHFRLKIWPWNISSQQYCVVLSSLSSLFSWERWTFSFLDKVSTYFSSRNDSSML